MMEKKGRSFGPFLYYVIQLLIIEGNSAAERRGEGCTRHRTLNLYLVHFSRCTIILEGYGKINHGIFVYEGGMAGDIDYSTGSYRDFHFHENAK